jgi:hypothetical protein
MWEKFANPTNLLSLGHKHWALCCTTKGNTYIQKWKDLSPNTLLFPALLAIINREQRLP